MANRRLDPVSYRKFQADPLLSEGLLSVSREGGDLERRVAQGMARTADYFGKRADRAAELDGARRGAADALAAGPGPMARQPAGGAIRVSSGGRTGSEKGQWLKQQLMADFDLTDAAAAAFAGNLDYESGGFETLQEIAPVVPGSRGGFGWSQWTGPRRRAFEAWATSNGLDVRSDEANYGFLRFELQNTEEGAVLDRLRGIDDPAEAARIVSEGFLRPGIVNMEERVRRTLAYAGGGDASVDRITTASVQPISVTPVPAGGTPGTWRPTGQDTIRGRAYDVAGTRTYLEQIETTMRSDQAAVFERYKDDPAMLERSLGELKIAHMREHVFEEIAPDYSTAYDRAALPLVERARDAAEQRAQEQNLASFMERTSALEEQKSRALIGATAGSAATMAELEAMQGTIDAHYDSAVARGVMTPSAASEQKVLSRRRMVQGFYVGQTEAMSADDIDTMREAMRADYASGELTGIDADGWFQLDTELKGIAADKRVQDKRASDALAERGDTIAARIASGYDVSEAEISKLNLDGRTGPDGERITAESNSKIAIARTIRDMPVSEAAKAVTAFQREQLALGSIEGERAAAFAGQALDAKITALRTDPITYAERRGLVTPDNGLASVESPEDLSALIAKRAGDAEMISERYGTPVRYLKAGEADQLADVLEKDLAQGGAMTFALVDGGGGKIFDVLPEIAAVNAPLAHIVGVTGMTGDRSVLRDAGRVLADRESGAVKIKLPSENVLSSASVSVAGPAFESLPETQQSVLSVATLLFEREAARSGFDPADVNVPGTAAFQAYERSMNRALGARTVDGRQLGGLGDVNGARTLIPTDMSAGDVEARLRGLTDATLAELPPIASANGVPVSAEQLRAGQLVAIGDGRYYVATGDVASGDPRYAMAEDGALWVLDIRKLKPNAASPANIPYFGTSLPWSKR